MVDVNSVPNFDPPVDIRVWSNDMSAYRVLTGYESVSFRVAPGSEPGDGEIRLRAEHPLVPRFHQCSGDVIPVTMLRNGELWSGTVVSARTMGAPGHQSTVVELRQLRWLINTVLGFPTPTATIASQGKQDFKKGHIRDVAMWFYQRNFPRINLPAYLITTPGSTMPHENEEDPEALTSLFARMHYMDELLDEAIDQWGYLLDVQWWWPGMPVPNGTLRDVTTATALEHYTPLIQEGIFERIAAGESTATGGATLQTGWEPAVGDFLPEISRTLEAGATGEMVTDWLNWFSDRDVSPENTGIFDIYGVAVPSGNVNSYLGIIATIIDAEGGEPTQQFQATVDVVAFRWGGKWRVATVEQARAHATGHMKRVQQKPVAVTTPAGWTRDDTNRVYEAHSDGVLRSFLDPTKTSFSWSELSSLIGESSSGSMITEPVVEWNDGDLHYAIRQSQYIAQLEKLEAEFDVQTLKHPAIMVQLKPRRRRPGVELDTAPGGGIVHFTRIDAAPEALSCVVGGKQDRWLTELGNLATGILVSVASGWIAHNFGTPLGMLANGLLGGLFGRREPKLIYQRMEFQGGADGKFGPFAPRETFLNASAGLYTLDTQLAARKQLADKGGGSSLEDIDLVEGTRVVLGESIAHVDGRVTPGVTVGDVLTFRDGDTSVTDYVSGWEFSHRVGERQRMTFTVGRRLDSVDPVQRQVNAMIDDRKRIKFSALTFPAEY